MSANVCLEGEKKRRNKNIREQFTEPLLHSLNGKCCAESAASGETEEWHKKRHLPLKHLVFTFNLKVLCVLVMQLR